MFTGRREDLARLFTGSDRGTRIVGGSAGGHGRWNVAALQLTTGAAPVIAVAWDECRVLSACGPNGEGAAAFGGGHEPVAGDGEHGGVRAT